MAESLLRLGRWTIALDSGLCRSGPERRQLSAGLVELLRILASSPESLEVSHAVEERVHALRRVLEEDPSRPVLLLTGAAYHLDPLGGESLPAAVYGRTALLRRIWAAALPGRVISLVGAGGIGKTVLARAVAGLLPGRSAFLDLSRCSARAGVDDVLRRHLGGDTDPATLWRRRRVQLVVLDNCEQVRDAVVPLVSELANPDLCVLLTSRVPVGVGGEFTIAVPPLDRPAERAICLRTARELGLVPPDSAELDPMLEHLDGNPLAIEMAAARMAAFRPAEIAAQLDSSHALRRVGAEGRHSSMRATFEWTHGLLRPDEREALDRIASFAAPPLVEVALRALEGLGRPPLELLRALRTHALVHRIGRRVGVREGIVEFVAETHHPADPALLADALAPPRPDGPDWLPRMECGVSDVQDLRRSFHWAQTRDRQLASRLAGEMAMLHLGLPAREHAALLHEIEAFAAESALPGLGALAATQLTNALRLRAHAEPAELATHAEQAVARCRRHAPHLLGLALRERSAARNMRGETDASLDDLREAQESLEQSGMHDLAGRVAFLRASRLGSAWRVDECLELLDALAEKVPGSVTWGRARVFRALARGRRHAAPSVVELDALAEQSFEDGGATQIFARQCRAKLVWIDDPARAARAYGTLGEEATRLGLSALRDEMRAERLFMLLDAGAGDALGDQLSWMDEELARGQAPEPVVAFAAVCSALRGEADRARRFAGALGGGPVDPTHSAVHLLQALALAAVDDLDADGWGALRGVFSRMRHSRFGAAFEGSAIGATWPRAVSRGIRAGAR